MKKNRLLLAVLCASLTGNGQQPPPPPALPSQDLSVTVNEGIELLSVIQYLGSQLGNSTPSPYKTALKSFFLPYRAHPAVTTIFLMDKTIYPDLTELGLLFYNFPDIHMRPMPDSADWYKHISKKELAAYLQLCMQFYKDTKFHAFYASHSSDYSSWGAGLRKALQTPVDIFAALFSSSASLHWLVCLDPLNDWGAHTITPGKLVPAMKNYIVYQLGYFGDKDSLGQMSFSMNVYDLAWHESTHAICDAILQRYRNEIAGLSDLMKTDASLRRQNITDWPHYFNELIARSVSIALHREYRSAAEYQKLLQTETNRGFPHARDVSDLIYEKYIHTRTSQPFADIFPLIFQMLRTRYRQTSLPQPAQDLHALMAKADSCYQKKNYKQAVVYGEALYAADSSSDGCTYNLACYHALAGNPAKAIYYVKKAFSLGYAARYLQQDEDLNNLHDLPEWPSLLRLSRENYENSGRKRAVRDAAVFARYTQWQAAWEHDLRISPDDADTTGTAPEIYRRLRQLGGYRQPASFNRWLFLYQPVAANSSILAPYALRLPIGYDANRSYPLLVVLHGAVRMQSSLPAYADSSIGGYFHRHFTKYADQAGMIVVYPLADQHYNWMFPDSGFQVTPSIIRHLKQFLNIDDDAVYCTGHSNGATGSFSYLIKQPGLFAGFSGMNTQPVIRTGGTFLTNARNRNFYNIGTDKDYYFPPAANDSITGLADRLGIRWTTALYQGFPHWFPQFDTADGPVGRMFGSMLAYRRQPFQPTLSWETDDIKYGRCDWLSITALDTTTPRAPWHLRYNFTIPYWIDNNDPDKIIDSTSIAFKYPRRSGAVKAVCEHNVFTVSASCVAAIRIYLSPEMVDLDQPVTVILNGKKVFGKKVPWNKAFMLESFRSDFDRKAIWMAYIDLK